MKIGIEHKKKNCPSCGSKEILTLGLDQMCCACDWDNSLLLVKLGQLDSLFEAARQQFGDDATFAVPDENENKNTTDHGAVEAFANFDAQRIA